MKYFVLLSLLLGGSVLHAQGEIAYGTFRGTRIIAGHSVETLQAGEMEFLISHRFGRVNGGAYEFFGLDQASIRLGLDYGLKDWVLIGVGRSSEGKHYDLYGKVRLLRQRNKGKMPVSLTAFSSVALNGLRNAIPEEPIAFQNRLSYTFQGIIARKFSDRFSLQVMPTMVHYNLVESKDLKNDVYSIGAAGKFQLTKNLALTSEFYYVFPDQLTANMRNSLSVGFDINTGSHVFQLHFTNSSGMIEKMFIGETTGSWANGDIHFGFNISRTFKLKGRRY